MPDSSGYRPLSSAEAQSLETSPSKDELDDPSLPTIQFSSPHFIVTEGAEPEAILEVYRIGTDTQLNQTSTVEFRTADDSATAGRNYVSQQGILVFKAEETQQTVKIKLVNNDLWDTTSEFRVVLQQDGLHGGVLGRFLFECRVKIVDNNSFPTGAYKKFDPKDRQSALAFRLPSNFFFMNFHNSQKVRHGTIKFLMVDAVHNLWYLISLLMGVYLLDFIVDREAPASKLLFIHDKKVQLMIYVGITFTALFVMHVLDYQRLSFGVGGGSRSFLQAALMRKYLNYVTRVRSDMDSGTLVMAIHRDVPECVGSYFKILALVRVFGQLAMMIVFKGLSVYFFHAKIDLKSIVPALTYPIFMLFFLRCRQSKTVEVLDDKCVAEEGVTNAVSETTSNSVLILDHYLRNYASNNFNAVIKTFNGKSKAAGQVMMNNVYFSRWGALIIVGAYIYSGGMELIDGLVSTGMFVTNLKVIEAWCKAFEEQLG
jgi:hypothetical protein